MSKIDIRAIIECAQRAPSGDNCQPFHFSWSDPVLKIYFNYSIAKHRLDFGLYASRISLGATMELIDIAASQQNCKVSWEVFSLQSQDNHLVAQASFITSEDITPDPLYAFVFDRYCNREVYDGSEPNTSLLKSLEIESQKSPTLHINVISKFDSHLIHYLKVCELLLWRRPQVVLDIFRWVRWTLSSYKLFGDGIYWKELGAKYVEFPILRLIRLFPWIPRIFSQMGLGFVFKDVVERNVKSSSGLILISGKTMDSSNMESVGRMGIRLWLTATKEGLSMQPLTLQSLSIYGFKTHQYFSDLSQHEVDVLNQGDAILHSAFKIPVEFTPIWMFRVGRPKSKKSASLRKPYASVVKP